MNGIWKKLCPQFFNDFKGFNEVNKDLVILSTQLQIELEEQDFIQCFEADK